MRNALIVIGCGMAAFAVFIVVLGRQDAVPVADRVKRECERLHPYIEEEANNCRIALMLRYIEDAETAKMNRAYQRIK